MSDNMVETVMELQRQVANLQHGPSGRAISIAITHLQTAILWLQKAVVDGEA